MVSDDAVARVKQTARIIDVITHYCGRPEKSTGGEAWWRCPFHDEKTPSFHAVAGKGYKCFGCDASGDTIGFVQAMEGCEFPQAVEKLAGVCGIPLDKADTGGKRKPRPPKPPAGPPKIDRLEREGAAWAARVQFPDGGPHEVLMTESGGVVCDCRGFQHRGACRHRDLAINRFGAPRAPREQDDDHTPVTEEKGVKGEPVAGGRGEGISLQDLADAKGIPVSFLRELGCYTAQVRWKGDDGARLNPPPITKDADGGGVIIPYHLPDGSRAPRPRCRLALSAKNGSPWGGDRGEEIVPYGLERLSDARRTGELVIVEGETDCWTLWHVGIPALGLPGASMAGKIRAEDLAGIQKIFIIDERDQGGKTLVEGIAKRLVDLDYRGQAWRFNMGKAKDPNDAWQKCAGDTDTFLAGWRRCLDGAKPLRYPDPPPAPWEPRNVSEEFLRYGGAFLTPGHRHTSLAWWRDGWWAWNGQHYRPLGEGELRGHLARFIERRDWEEHKKDGDGFQVYTEPKSATRATVKNVLQSLEGHCVVSGSIEPPAWEGHPLDRDILILQNGILYLDQLWEKIGQGGHDPEAAIDVPLRPHTPDLFALHGLPYKFDPKAGCDQWLEFLDRVMPDEEKQMILAQWAGYCLIPTNRYQKLLILTGEGANGKSVIQGVLRQLVGAHNCSAAPLEQLHEPHALQPLVGKLLNLANEWGYLHQTGLATLKQVSGGDPVTINPKHSAPYEAVLPTRWLVSTNEPPSVQDRSDAFWRRVMIIPFDVQIPEKEQIPLDPFVQKLCRELPGILNWALLGLYELIQNDGFSVPGSMRMTAREMRETSNPAATWCSDNLKVLPGARLKLSNAYEDYREFCKNGGYKPLNIGNFAKEPRRWYHRKAGRDPDTVRERDNGRREKFLVGMCFVGEES